MIRKLTIVVATALLCGCQVVPSTTRRIDSAGPPLPVTISRDDLIQHLNAQAGHLKAWQSTNVRLTARMPGAPLGTPPLKGSIACESPNRFRLLASNFAARTDMGANSERCWFSSSPGHNGVISWKHEDAHLLQEFPSGVPYIDPDWLMLVLGVKQLDPDDYVLSQSTQTRTPELWLTSFRDTHGGDTCRYVIKVNPRHRVVREHAAYDEKNRLIVSATLGDHRWFNGHLLPTTVRINLPSSDAQLKLSIADIETEPAIDSAMWKVPSMHKGQNVDLGEMIASVQRQQRSANRWESPESVSRAHLRNPVFERDAPFHQAGADLVPDRRPSPTSAMTAMAPEEPVWADPVADRSPFQQESAAPAGRRRFLGLFPVSQ